MFGVYHTSNEDDDADYDGSEAGGGRYHNVDNDIDGRNNLDRRAEARGTAESSDTEETALLRRFRSGASAASTASQGMVVMGGRRASLGAYT